MKLPEPLQVRMMASRDAARSENPFLQTAAFDIGYRYSVADMWCAVKALRKLRSMAEAAQDLDMTDEVFDEFESMAHLADEAIELIEGDV